MKRFKIYVVCTIFLICLVLSAFFAPGLVMKIYDKEQLSEYEFQFRPGVDYEAVNGQYVEDREERLGIFAKGTSEKRQYYIAAAEDEVANKEEIIARILDGELSYWLSELGIIWWMEELYDGSGLTDWEHYIVYDKEGVVFLTYYMELSFGNEIIRILADSHDYTIYYLECYQPGISYIMSNSNTDGEMSGLWSEIVLLEAYYAETSEVHIMENYKNYVISNVENSKIKQGFASVSEDQFIGERELVSDMKYEQGKLQLYACFLDKQGDFYGFGVGIKELRELLPEYQIGVLLESAE